MLGSTCLSNPPANKATAPDNASMLFAKKLAVAARGPDIPILIVLIISSNDFAKSFDDIIKNEQSDPSFFP